MAASPFAFLASASSSERRTLAASTLGWMLDGMDVTLYAMVIPAVEAEFHLSSGAAGMLASTTLVASALGGVLFGLLADRAGRRTALMASVVVYSVFTAACGLSRTVGELAVFRALLGLGVGGEWAAGASLVAETWRAEHRGKALGYMQSGFAAGYAMAAILAAWVLPRWGWRGVFFAGLLPAALALWIRGGVDESPAWLEARRRPASFSGGASGAGNGERRAHSSLPRRERAKPAPRASADADSRPSYAGLIVRTLLMNSAALFAWWGLFTWIPSYLALPVARGGRGLGLAASSRWILVMQAGMWLGYVSFGYASDRVGARRTYIGFLLLAACAVPLYAQAGSTGSLLLLGPVMAFVGTGHFTGFGVIAAELFPTRFRASAMGLTYNFGRALSAAAPWAIGVLAVRWGFASAFWMSAAAFLAAALIAWGLPKSRMQDLAP
ncbi:MAG TPA: MFS transporter [Terriglobia bacterium]|nr:MFS transporter [Terriglobia bacterium]